MAKDKVAVSPNEKEKLIREAALSLKADGIYPSNAKVRERVGNRFSLTDIQAHMVKFRQEEEQAQRVPELDNTIRATFDHALSQAWSKLYRQNMEELNVHKETVSETLKQKEAELTETYEELEKKERQIEAYASTKATLDAKVSQLTKKLTESDKALEKTAALLEEKEKSHKDLKKDYEKLQKELIKLAQKK